MKLTDAIIKRINELFEERKLPISKWSIKAGITPSTVYSIMKRTAGCPRIQTIKLLCDYIKLPLSEFFNVDYINNAEYEEEQ